MTRDKAIEIIGSARAVVLANGEYDEAMRMAIEALKAEPKHGEWVEISKYHSGTCSVCGDRWGSVDEMHYCPSCGADMREAKV